MLKIYCNTASDSENVSIWLNLTGTSLTARVRDIVEEIEETGEHVVEELLPYHSYAFVQPVGSHQVKSYKKIYRSPYRFIDLNRLGTATRFDFQEIMALYSQRSFLQVDTGMVAEEERDIIVRVFVGSKDKLKVEADIEYEILDFNSEELQTTAFHPRNTLWDSYAVIVDGHEYMANKKGTPLGGDGWGEKIALPRKQHYVEVTVQKYKGRFTEPLSRDYDDDEVMIDCSAGVLSTRRLRLVNGRGSFRLYPMGHTGEFKLKLGRKWYEVWNDYLLELA